MTLNAHGVVYFNASERDDEVYFVDELVHQCGHVIFNAMTVQRRELFLVDPDAPIADVCPAVPRHEVRSLYTVLHGLYTERAMVQCLRKLDERGKASRGVGRTSCGGALAFIVRKMADRRLEREPRRSLHPVRESLVDDSSARRGQRPRSASAPICCATR